MSETSINNQEGYRDDTMPKTVDTKRSCEVYRSESNLLQSPPYILGFGGCRRMLHTLTPTSQGLLVSTVFGTVSYLHPSLFCYSYMLDALYSCV